MILCVLSLCFALEVASLTFAQDDQRPLESTSGVSGKRLSARPTRLSDAFYPFIAGEGYNETEYKILIYLSSAPTQRVIYHRPILIFEENTEENTKTKKTLEGFPSVVWGVEKNDDGTTRLRFRVKLMTDRTKALIRDEFYDSEIGKRYINDVWKIESADDIDVLLNDLDGITIRCVKDNIVLSQFKSVSSMSTRGNVLQFWLDFTPSNLKVFLDGTTGGNDDILFIPIISSFSSVTVEGRSKISGKIDTVRSIQSVLGSKQFDPDAPIFQEERNQAISEINASITKTMYMTDPKLFVMLDSHDSIAQKVFTREKPLDWDVLSSDPQLLARFHEYITPHLQTLAQTSGNEVIEDYEDGTSQDLSKTDSETKTTSKTKGFKVGVKGGVGAIGGNAEYSENRTDSKSNTRAVQDAETAFQNFQKQTGTSWQKSTTDGYYRPHQITVHKFNKGQETISLNEDFSVFLQLNDYDQAEMDSGTPISLTEKTFEKRMPKSSDIPGYEGCPVGAVLPFFGRTPPPGWVWIDPDNKFPNSSAFPLHLHDEPMPDMSKAVYMGTAPSAEEVGKFHDAKDFDHTHFAKTEPYYIAEKQATPKGTTVVSAERVTGGNIAKVLEEKIGQGIRSNNNSSKDMMQYRKAVLSVFCDWSDSEYWNNKDHWDKNPKVGETRGKKSVVIGYDRVVTSSERTGRKSTTLEELTREQAVTLSTRKGTQDAGKKTVEYTYAQVINDPVKIIEVMTYHWKLKEPWHANGYFPANTEVLDLQTAITVPEINIPTINAPVLIDPDDAKSLPSHVKSRWIIRIR